jgi:hypothetical protein
MTKPFFEKQLGLLIIDFGQAEYTPSRVNLIWEYCKDLPEYNFQRIIKHFLDTRPIKYPPLPTHFQEAALEQQKLLELQGIGNSKFSKPGEYSNTPIKDIMKKLGGESAVEVLEKHLSKKQNTKETL